MSTIVTQETAYLESAGPKSEVANFWRLPTLGNLECLKAAFEQHRYAPHIHDTYAIGVIERGLERFTYRGQKNTAGAGTFAVVEPGELHDGEPGEGGYQYKMAYPSQLTMNTICRDLWDRDDVRPHFRDAVVDDRELYRMFVCFHDGAAPNDIGCPAVDPFTSDSRHVELFSLMVARHGDASRPYRPLRRETGPVTQACRILLEQMAEPPGLEAVAETVGLSRFRLIRAFRRELGLPPQAWLQSQRVAQAKQLIAGGKGLAEIAASVGFSDQPHLTRVFKSHIGVTPAVYRAGL